MAAEEVGSALREASKREKRASYSVGMRMIGVPCICEDRFCQNFEAIRRFGVAFWETFQKRTV